MSEPATEQEQIGLLILSLKDLYPESTASERADVVMEVDGTEEGREIHSGN